MAKVYYNLFNNIAVVIDDKAKTITTSKFNELDVKGYALYPAKARRLKEVFRFYRNSGYARA